MAHTRSNARARRHACTGSRTPAALVHATHHDLILKQRSHRQEDHTAEKRNETRQTEKSLRGEKQRQLKRKRLKEI